MNLRFRSKQLLQLYTSDSGTAKKSLPPDIVERFFVAVDDVSAAVDERDLRRVPGYHFEKVPRECDGCYSLRLGKQFRLILKLSDEAGGKTVEIIDVRDYH